jgi:tRNA(fMet)-specific endonuclease VapC
VSPKYLLDTDVISEPLRPKPDQTVIRKIKRHAEEIAICTVVWHELRYGVARLPASRRREALEDYLFAVVDASVPIIDYDRAAAEWHATERARLVARGKTPPLLDGQIAAIAHVNDLTLVTFNAADFKSFSGLRVVDWR